MAMVWVPPGLGTPVRVVVWVTPVCAPLVWVPPGLGTPSLGTSSLVTPSMDLSFLHCIQRLWAIPWPLTSMYLPSPQPPPPFQLHTLPVERSTRKDQSFPKTYYTNWTKNLLTLYHSKAPCSIWTCSTSLESSDFCLETDCQGYGMTLRVCHALLNLFVYEGKCQKMHLFFGKMYVEWNWNW